MKRHLTRLTGFLILAVMLVGMWSITAFAALAPINSVTLSDVTTPVAGETPDFDVTLNGTGFELDEDDEFPAISWGKYNPSIEDFDLIDETTPFEAGIYMLCVALRSQDGYEFDEDTKYYFGGDELPDASECDEFESFYYDYYDFADYDEVYGEYAIICIYFTVEESVPNTPIDSVTVSDVTTPVVGETPDFDLTLTGAGVEFKEGGDYIGISWGKYDTSTGDLNEIDEYTPFEEGVYVLDVFLQAQNGYVFDENTKFYFGGDELPYASECDEFESFYYDFAGDDELDELYGEYAIISIYFTVEESVPKTPIDSATVSDVTTPVVGATPDYDVTLTGAGVEFYEYGEYIGISWGKYNPSIVGFDFIDETTPFEAGIYVLLVELQAQNGYEFDEDTKYYFGGDELPYITDLSNFVSGYYDYADYDEVYGEYATIYIFFTVEESVPDTPIDSATVNGVTTPVAGETPDFDVTLTGAGVEFYEDGEYIGISWGKYDPSDDEFYPIDASTPFEAGIYVLFVQLKAQDGYVFDENTKFYFGGNMLPKEGECEDFESCYAIESDDCAILGIFFTIEDSVSDTPIDSVTVSGVTTPVAGETPDFDVTVTGAGFKAIYWLKYDPSDDEFYPIDASTPFEAGIYVLFVQLKAQDGYVFDENTKFYFGGNMLPKEGECEDFESCYAIESDDCAILGIFFTVEDSVTIGGISTPVMGTTPDFDLTLTAANVELNYDNGDAIYWIKYNPLTDDLEIVDASTPFEAGIYVLLIGLKAQDGYVFDENTKFYFGGNMLPKEDECGDFESCYAIENDLYAQICIVFTVADTSSNTPIDSVTVSGVTTPVVGATPDLDVTLTGAELDDDVDAGAYWLKYNPSTDDFDVVDEYAPFEAGVYVLFIKLKAQDGYKFNESTKFYFGGDELPSEDDITDLASCYAIENDLYAQLCIVFTVADSGSNTPPESHTHTGGTATCTDRATCTYCGEQYGDTEPHKFTVANGYKGEDGHANTCSCGAKDTVTPHNPNRPEPTENDPVKCTVCKYIITPATNHVTHTPGTEWVSDGTYHWHECTGCEGQQLDKEAHTGGKATCTRKAKCSICRKEYGTTAEHNYAVINGYKVLYGHANTCVCGAHDDLIPHTPDRATPTLDDPVKCTGCGYIIEPALGHVAHTPKVEWVSDGTYHWHECTGCEGQQIDKTSHTDKNSDNKCDVCGRSVSISSGSSGTTSSSTTGSTTKPTRDPKNKKDGLSGGAIAGIVVGSTAVAGAGGFSAVWFGVKKKTFGDLKNAFKKSGNKQKKTAKTTQGEVLETPENPEIPETPETPENEG